MNPRQLQAVWFSKRVASPLAEAVKEGLRSGNLVGEPKVGGYTVVPEGIVVEATVSVVVPPSKVLAEAPPKESLKLLFDTPSLLAEIPADRIKDIPFKALKGPQFSTFVKKMGGLSQYSDEILHALLEGRKHEDYETDENVLDIFYDAARKDVDRYIGAPWVWNDWGGGDSLHIKIKGGIITGVIYVAVEWGDFRNTRDLPIKRDIDELPYVTLDPAVHGEGAEDDGSSRPIEKSTHPIFPKSTYWETGRNLRVETLPKGTPGVWRVDVKRSWHLEKTSLTGLDRKNLETLVQWFAEG